MKKSITDKVLCIDLSIQFLYPDLSTGYIDKTIFLEYIIIVVHNSGRLCKFGGGVSIHIK